MTTCWHLFLSMTLVLVAPAQDAPEKAEPIANLVGEEVAVVVHVDLTRIDVGDLARRTLGGLAEENQIDEATQVLNGWIEAMRQAGAQDFYLLIDPLDLPGVPLAVVTPAEGREIHEIGPILRGESSAPKLFAWPSVTAHRGVVLAGSPEALERVRLRDPVARPEVTAALAAAKDAPASFLLVPSATQRRVLDEMLPILPEEIGGGPVSVLTKGLRWGAITLTTEPATSLEILVQAQDAESAEKLQQIIKAAKNLGRQMLESQEGMAELAEALGEITPRVEGDQLTMAANLEEVSALVGVPIKQARAAAQRSQSMNNLKQLGLAMHNYASAHKTTFPPAYNADADGKPLLSWRVHLLPYLDQQALYDEFHLDEPWDSPHNKALIERMPAAYRNPTLTGPAAGEFKTAYLVPRGDETIFSGPEGKPFKEIYDGTSNTIIVVEANADQAVIWTQPEDWEIGAEPTMAPLVGLHQGGTNALFADGSARFLAESINPMVLKALLTHSGGEVVSQDAY